MSVGLASGHYQMEQTVNQLISAALDPEDPLFGVAAPLVDKWGATLPNALLHLNLQGIVANDLSYITNPAAEGAYSPDRNSFKVDPPDGLTAITMKFRLKVINDFLNGEAAVHLYQGNPEDDDSTAIASYLFPSGYPGGRAAVPVGTWIDFSVVVNIALITDIKDLWTNVRFLRGTGASSSLIRMSWLVLEVLFPYGRGEVPGSKNYVNSLTEITNVSIRTVGTAGTSKYCYRVVPFDSDGVDGPASDEFVIETGHATLDSDNYVCLSWLDVDDAAGYKVYRTCAPSGYGLGLLDTVLPDAGDCGGGGGGGIETGYKDDGSDCEDEGDCEDFDEDALEGCQGVSAVTYPAKETPS